jgi:hypothetical protein
VLSPRREASSCRYGIRKARQDPGQIGAYSEISRNGLQFPEARFEEVAGGSSANRTLSRVAAFQMRSSRGRYDRF